MRVRGTARFCVAVAFGVATIALAACSADPPSFVIGVSTQMRVPKDLRSVRVITTTGQSRSCSSFAIDGADVVPRSVTITGSAGQEVRVTVAGYADALAAQPADPCAIDGARVVRRARTHFVDGESLYLPMPLRYLCSNVTCGDDQSCFAGVCAPSDVDARTLVSYADPLLHGSTSFCVSTGNCLDHRSPVFLSDPAACTFSFAIDDVAFDNQGVNIELVHDDFEREVIDVGDTLEGFTYDPKKTKQFTLAPALCDAVKSGKVTVVSAGVGCQAKTNLNPMCDAAHERDNGRPKEGARTCTSAQDVAPTPNALYFLVDRSPSMSAFYTQSSGSLANQLDLVMQSPLMRTTQVAMKLLPAAASECTSATSSFATPDVPFALANQQHSAISAKLDPSNLAQDDAPIYLDAALRENASYAALSAFDPLATNTREVIVIGNRRFDAMCDPVLDTTAGLALRAREDSGYRTGAILLPAPPGTDQGGHDPFVDAVAMTRNGFGVFADGSTNNDAAAIGVLGAFDSLESCVYDLPPGADTTNVAQSFLTYFDIVVQNRIDIPYAPLCIDDTSAVDGWNLSGNRLRVCGASCAAIKYVLDTSGLYAISHHIAPPLVPFRWSPPCAP